MLFWIGSPKRIHEDKILINKNIIYFKILVKNYYQIFG